jgi:hypothetical protein
MNLDEIFSNDGFSTRTILENLIVFEYDIALKAFFSLNIFFPQFIQLLHILICHKFIKIETYTN